MLKRVAIPDYANLKRADMNFRSILLPLQSVDFGYEFSNMLNLKKTQGLISPDDDTILLNRCQSFLVRACKELGTSTFTRQYECAQED